MRNEREFVRSYSSFWRDTLPYCEVYVRYINANFANTYEEELSSDVAPNRRALVNEMAFDMFAASLIEGGVDIVLRSSERFQVIHAQTLENMRRFLDFGLPEGPLSAEEREEVGILARRIESFFARYPARPLVHPTFPGCGMLDGVAGDIIVEKTLYEVKAGERSCRVVDLRQLLTYCALNYSTGSHDIERVGFVNPRTGMFFEENLGVVCARVSGEAIESVLGRIRGFLAGALASP